MMDEEVLKRGQILWKSSDVKVYYNHSHPCLSCSAVCWFLLSEMFLMPHLFYVEGQHLLVSLIFQVLNSMWWLLKLVPCIVSIFNSLYSLLMDCNQTSTSGDEKRKKEIGFCRLLIFLGSAKREIWICSSSVTLGLFSLFPRTRMKSCSRI